VTELSDFFYNRLFVSAFRGVPEASADLNTSFLFPSKVRIQADIWPEQMTMPDMLWPDHLSWPRISCSFGFRNMSFRHLNSASKFSGLVNCNLYNRSHSHFLYCLQSTFPVQTRECTCSHHEGKPQLWAAKPSPISHSIK